MAVVVVNWNARDDLLRCLRSLAAQSDAALETIVVDNGSSDDSCEAVRREFPEIHLIATGENLGFAEGCNRGLAAAGSDWVATLNNDAEADRRWIEVLRRAAREAAPDVGMIQSRILFRQRPEITNSTGVAIHKNGVFVDRDFERPAAATARGEEIFCPSAGAALYRRRMLCEARLPSGFFDRTFFMYFEDVDLGWRCRLAGWRALYSPDAIVLHDFHGSSRRVAGDFVHWHCGRNRIRTLLKNASWRYVARALPYVAGDFARSLHGRGGEAVLGYARAVRDGLGQRAAVTRLAQRRRREIELRWVT
jgi:hypothetical protein